MKQRFPVRCLVLVASVVLMTRAGATPPEGGTINFNNRLTDLEEGAPVFEPDGVTRLEGSRYLAQLWAGGAPDSLQPVGAPVEFRTGMMAGYFRQPGGTVVIPHVAAGATAWLEVRAWDGTFGEDFTEAFAAGGPAGRSEAFAVVTGGSGMPPEVPANLVGLRSFALEWRDDVPPVILRQPQGGIAFIGQPFALTLTLVHLEGVQFQWLRDGVEIPGATGPELAIGAIGVNDAGIHQVRASNAYGSTLSDPALVEVQNSFAPAAAVLFSNRLPGWGVDAPVFARDGTTPLSGASFLAQLYLGPTPELLRPAGLPAPFLSGEDAGYWQFQPGEFVVVPGVAPGEEALIQVRVWEAAAGGSFEEAVAQGGTVGASGILGVVTGGGPDGIWPVALTGLSSFNLVAPPAIVVSPASTGVMEGEPAEFGVVADGGSLTYQWLLNGALIPDANGPVLRLAAATWADAGEYRVRVSNAAGVVVSAPAVLSIRTQEPRGTVYFANLGPDVDAPVFHADGITRVEGPAFVAGLWVGPDADSLTPVGAVVPFQTGPQAGYWERVDAVRTIPNVVGGEVAWVQVRAWEVAFGPDYGEAMANGGAFGASDPFPVLTGGGGSPPAVPAHLMGLQSFALNSTPPPPEIVLPPLGGQYFVGEPVGLSVLVEGAGLPGLEYHWFRNGVVIAGANGDTFTLPAVALGDTGFYSVTVGDGAGAFGTTAPALVGVRMPPPGATLRFSNHIPAYDLDAPVLHADGIERVSGPGFVAQLWTGINAQTLQPATDPQPLLSGDLAGYWEGAEPLATALPQVTPGAPVSAQIRVWETGYADFESARTAGAWIGFSEVLEVATGGSAIQVAPAPLTGLESIVLGRIPLITDSPTDGEYAAGWLADWQVSVDSPVPVDFQWLKDGVDIPGATSDSLGFETVAMADAGLYRVRVTNRFGAVMSPAFRVEVIVLQSGGLVRFSTYLPSAGIDAPVFLEDGVTPLDGPDFKAQLYGGPSADALVPLAPVAAFTYGYVLGNNVARLETVPPGGLAVLQLRAWEGRVIASYEEAVQTGGRAGVSELIEVVAGGWQLPAAPLTGLESFVIQARVPVITQQPVEVWIGEGEEAVFFAGAAGEGELHYQWQYRAPDTEAWEDLPNETSRVLRRGASRMESDGSLFRLMVANEWGSTVTLPAMLRVVPIMALGDQEGAFTLRLLPGTGPDYQVEFSSDLAEWQSSGQFQTGDAAFSFHEAPEIRSAHRQRFYRARDAATGEVASENIAGFLRIVLPPGMNMLSVQLAAGDPRVAALLPVAPDDTMIYEYDPEDGWFINSFYEGDGWFDPERRLGPGRGYFLRTADDFAPDLTLAGDVPRGDYQTVIPSGWSLQSLPFPLAGRVHEDFFLPFDHLDVLAFWRPAIWSFDFYVKYGDGWHDGVAPFVEVGEAFWVYRSQPAEWAIRYDYPP